MTSGNAGGSAGGSAGEGASVNPDVVPIAGDSSVPPTADPPPPTDSGADTGNATFANLPADSPPPPPPPDPAGTPGTGGYVSPLFGSRPDMNPYTFGDPDEDPRDERTRRADAELERIRRERIASTPIPNMDEDPTSGATFVGVPVDPPPPPPVDPADATFATMPSGSTPDGAPRAPGVSPTIIAAAVAVLALVAIIGAVVMHGGSGSSSAPAPSGNPPTKLAAAPSAGARAPQAPPDIGPVVNMIFWLPAFSCSTPGSLTLKVTIANAKPGDVLHATLTGPGLPSTVDLPLGGDLTASTSVTVSGAGMWTATVDTVGGKPVFRPDPGVGHADYTQTCNG